MKKRSTIIACMAFFATQAMAQSSGIKMDVLRSKLAWFAHTQPAAVLFEGKSTAKTTATLRLSAIAKRNSAVSPPSLTDSTRYAYNDTRGWGTDNPVLWDTADYYTMPATASQKYVQTFDGHNNILTRTTLVADGSGSWNNNATDTFTYDAADHVLKHVSYQWTLPGTWQISSNMAYYYSGGLLDSTIEASYAFGIPDKTTREVYSYNTKNIVATVLESTLDAGAGNWEEQFYFTRNFDPADALALSETVAIPYTGGWLKVVKYRYSYDASGNRVTQLLSAFDGADWVDYMNVLIDYNTSNKPAQVLMIDMETDPSLPDSTRDNYVYNAENLIATITTEQLDHAAGSFMPKEMVTYYYSEKIPKLITTVNHGGSVSLYPVPVNDELTLDLQWDKVQKAAIAICDLQGRVWQQWALPAVQQYKEKVTLRNLPSGNYILRISGSENARVTQAFTIVH
jgi:hypothetical protein